MNVRGPNEAEIAAVEAAITRADKSSLAYLIVESNIDVNWHVYIENLSEDKKDFVLDALVNYEKAF